jgi:non-ribosomal peptide synthetase component F
VERYAGYLRRVLRGMAADERRSVDRLPILPHAERMRVLEEWNATTAAYPAELCIHQHFERQVERAPEAVAVVFEGRSLTYAELNSRANRLAHHLRSLGVRPDARVAICVERGVEMILGLLAILKAGGAYVPLDPAYPDQRLRYMLDDSAPVVLLTQEALSGAFAGLQRPVIALDADADAWAERPETNPDAESVGLTSRHAAYVIYTSGSTGRPKGVVNEHRAVANQLAWSRETWPLRAGEAVLQRTSFSFDVSVRELFWPLAAGARLVVARPGGHGVRTTSSS